MAKEDRDMVATLLQDIFGDVLTTSSREGQEEKGAVKDGEERVRDEEKEDCEEEGEEASGVLDVSVVTVDGVKVTIDHKTGLVTSDDQALAGRVQRAIGRVQSVMLPIDCGC